MVDLPLIDEDTGVFGDEVAIQWCVFCGAKKQQSVNSLHNDRFSHLFLWL